ncbi:MAG: formyltetrahydrofolate deformylase, partial [Rhodocyclaceae bacterium]|nr:formyltetrahydrofolate deformylase [Rhodocyclaceae bacterium]
MHRERFYTLTASCPDRVGIVAAVSGFFAKHGGWILETTLHSEPPNDEGIAAYFMRLEIKADSLPFNLEGLRAAFKPVADAFEMTWKISDSARRKRVVILVSKQEHCLYDLLARWQSKE